jgi:hypothetical protein
MGLSMQFLQPSARPFEPCCSEFVLYENPTRVLGITIGRTPPGTAMWARSATVRASPLETWGAYFLADYRADQGDRAGGCSAPRWRIAATWLCTGLDPEQAFYRQSDVPSNSPGC